MTPMRKEDVYKPQTKQDLADAYGVTSRTTKNPYNYCFLMATFLVGSIVAQTVASAVVTVQNYLLLFVG